MRRPHPLLSCMLLVLGCMLGCAARIPKGRYGVETLVIEGVKDVDPFALRACLATREREAFALDLSKSPAPTCGEPPFSARRVHVPLWHWRWTDWPLYDPGVFERDLSRIERWYRARGYYGARILDASSSPPEALFGSQSDTDRVTLQLRIEENEPVRISSVSLRGTREMDVKLGEEMLAISRELVLGERFDEADFDTVKDKLLRAMRDAGYAEAELDGRVDLDPKELSAAIDFAVRPGALMEVGTVCVEGHGKLPADLILQAADLRPGRPFSESDIEDARTRIYQLRVLSEVEITAGRVDPKTGVQRFDDATPPRTGELTPFEAGAGAAPTAPVVDDEPTERVCRVARSGRSRPQVPVQIRVKPGKLYRVGIGAGLQIGVEDGQRAINATQQWDVHLFGYAEAHNVLGGLRRLRIEERPKLIFLAPFPRVTGDDGIGGDSSDNFRLGNNLSTLLEWPAFLEARTLLRLTATWDRGPDPYGARFIRDDFDVGLGPTRSFWKNRIITSFAVHVNPYVPRFTYGPAEERAAVDLAAERYNLFFLQQVVEWDTRNDRNSPTRGVYSRLEVLEAIPPSSWRYLRVSPELRGYIPLPYGLVIASRAGLGMIALRAKDNLTEELGRLGPRPYRLRGGGPYSVRGIQAGLLGLRDGQDIGFPGGTRSWIASVELRIPLGDALGVATFVDVGDVDGGSPSEKARFRFDRPNTTLGAGLRYKTIVGPIRLDVGVLVPKLQGTRSDASMVSYRDPLFRLNGAVHLTIGEAF